MSAGWNVRLRAPFWAIVSVGLLAWGLVALGGEDAKGPPTLIAVGGFGLLTSLAFMVFGRKRASREP